MATVKFYLSNPKVNGALRKDEVSIVAMFTKTWAQRFKVKTQEKIQPKYWDSRSQCVKTNCPDHLAINLYLSDFKRNLISTFRESKLSFTEFKALAQGQANSDQTLRHYESDSEAGIIDGYLNEMQTKMKAV